MALIRELEKPGRSSSSKETATAAQLYLVAAVALPKMAEAAVAEERTPARHFLMAVAGVRQCLRVPEFPVWFCSTRRWLSGVGPWCPAAPVLTDLQSW